MGYSTDYDITENSQEVQEEIENVSEYGSFQDVTWYNWKEDVTVVSLKFPDQVIKISGVGEEVGDVWKAYVKNGKWFVTTAQLVFEEFDESKLE